MSKLQAVFLDRDGTIGGTGHFCHPRDFTLYPGAMEAIALLKEAGIKLFAFTIQGRIALGEVTLQEYLDQFAAFGFDQAYICPHAPNDTTCSCKKPKPGLLLQAAQEHNLDLTRCAVVGDMGYWDMLPAAAVGAVKVLVRTGLGEGSLGEYRHTWADVEPDYVADDVLAAVQWLLARNG